MNASGPHTPDAITCRIEKLVYGGDGLARADGRVIFIPGTVEGETVTAEITQLKPRFARAQLCEVIVPSPKRIKPCCRVSDGATGEWCLVPGCVYDHVAYDEELRSKQAQLESFLPRLPPPSEAPEFLPPFASPQPLHYRNKMVLHAERQDGQMRLGYREEPSHRILDLNACPLACPPINDALAALRSGGLENLPDDTDVTFRATPRDGAVWWTSRQPLAPPCPEWLTEESPAGPLRVPPDGFYQVNPAVGGALTRTVAAWFSESADCAELLDLYCGVGVFGFACMAAGGTRLCGIESGRAAISAARLNARSLGIEADFRCEALGKSDVSLDAFIGNPLRTTAVVDPPRDGMLPPVVAALARSGIARLFYVSCDPATLARDVAALQKHGGYRMTRARLFDMFPRTAHFETLVELRKK